MVDQVAHVLERENLPGSSEKVHPIKYYGFPRLLILLVGILEANVQNISIHTALTSSRTIRAHTRFHIGNVIQNPSLRGIAGARVRPSIPQRTI